ncbi:MAG: hypothetical protein SFV55_13825, partial [Haliscomenobacter sp.]|uniref:hypothetical protein n=1 Tax=Haliscomenobacter sp. TaxID=2717303 RepID=UPI0029BAE827
KAIEGLGLPKAQCRPGSFLRNINLGHHGSYGCLLGAKNGQHYILTCAHAIIDQPDHLDAPDYLHQGQVWISGTSELLPIFDCQFAGASGMDYALLGPVDERYTNTIGQKERLQAGRRVSALDEGSIVRASLTRHSFITERLTVLKQHHIPKQEVQFSNGSVHTLHDLVRLEKISIEGDSGAMIYDHNRQVIGMIVASDMAFTYALKIESILAQLSETYEIVPC